MTTEVRRAYVDGRYGQMHVRLANAGCRDRPPLVCIHMSPMSGRVYEKFLGEIGEDRMGIAFDTPGFGLSDAPPAPPGIEDYAQAILSGMDALGISTSFDLMGYHTGSMTSVALAMHAPARVRRIIMISAPIFTVEERKEFHRYYAHSEPALDGSHLVKRWQGFAYHYLRPGATLEYVADVFRDVLLGGQIEWWGHRAAFEYELAKDLPRLTQPVLILNPGDDLDMQTRRAADMATLSHTLEVPGWGHGFLDAHTAEAAALTRAFLDASDDAPFANIAVPASAAAPRYPERVGSFPPAAAGEAARVNLSSSANDP